MLSKVASSTRQYPVLAREVPTAQQSIKRSLWRITLRNQIEIRAERDKLPSVVGVSGPGELLNHRFPSVRVGAVLGSRLRLRLGKRLPDFGGLVGLARFAH